MKEGRALRTETTVNDSYDFEIGRSIENLTALRERGDGINARLLEVEAGTEEARLSGPELTDLVLPTRNEGRPIPALRFGDPRVMALFAALVAIAHQAAGFSNAQLRRLVAALLSTSLEEYSRARMTYDLGRLLGHGLIQRLPHSHRYRLTDAGAPVRLPHQARGPRPRSGDRALRSARAAQRRSALAAIRPRAPRARRTRGRRGVRADFAGMVTSNRREHG